MTTKPTVVLSYIAGYQNFRYQAAIFESVPDSIIEPCPKDDPNNPGETLSCGDVAHAKFVTNETQVAKWAPTVHEFLKRMGVK